MNQKKVIKGQTLLKLFSFVHTQSHVGYCVCACTKPQFQGQIICILPTCYAQNWCTSLNLKCVGRVKQNVHPFRKMLLTVGVIHVLKRMFSIRKTHLNFYQDGVFMCEKPFEEYALICLQIAKAVSFTNLQTSFFSQSRITPLQNELVGKNLY